MGSSKQIYNAIGSCMGLFIDIDNANRDVDAH